MFSWKQNWKSERRHSQKQPKTPKIPTNYWERTEDWGASVRKSQLKTIWGHFLKTYLYDLWAGKDFDMRHMSKPWNKQSYIWLPYNQEMLFKVSLTEWNKVEEGKWIKKMGGGWGRVRNMKGIWQNGISFIPAICNNMDGPWGRYVKWNTSEKRQVLYGTTYMWNP